MARIKKYSPFTTPVLELLSDLGAEAIEFKDLGYIKLAYQSRLGLCWITVPHYHRYSYTVFLKFKTTTAPPRNLKPYNKRDQEYNFHSAAQHGSQAFREFKEFIKVIIKP